MWFLLLFSWQIRPAMVRTVRKRGLDRKDPALLLLQGSDQPEIEILAYLLSKN